MCVYWPTEPLLGMEGLTSHTRTCTAERTPLEKPRSVWNSRQSYSEADTQRDVPCHNAWWDFTTGSRFRSTLTLPEHLQSADPLRRLHGQPLHHLPAEIREQERKKRLNRTLQHIRSNVNLCVFVNLNVLWCSVCYGAIAYTWLSRIINHHNSRPILHVCMFQLCVHSVLFVKMSKILTEETDQARFSVGSCQCEPPSHSPHL